MMTKIPMMIVAENTPDECYVAVDDSGYTMSRDYDGLTPNGNKLNGRWVLWQRGKFIDFDQFRYDLAARHNLDID